MWLDIRTRLIFKKNQAPRIPSIHQSPQPTFSWKTLTNNNTHSLTHTLTLIYAHTHIYSHTLTQTPTYTLTPTPTITVTPIHTQTPTFNLTPKPSPSPLKFESSRVRKFENSNKSKFENSKVRKFETELRVLHVWKIKMRFHKGLHQFLVDIHIRKNVISEKLWSRVLFRIKRL